MYQLQSNVRCRDITRMGPEAFTNLCEILQEYGGLQPTKLVSIEEQVAKFLYILSHNVRNWATSFFFHHSSETISHHFHSVLRSIISLEEQFLCQPTRVQVSPKVKYSSRFYLYFKVQKLSF